MSTLGIVNKEEEEEEEEEEEVEEEEEEVEEEEEEEEDEEVEEEEEEVEEEEVEEEEEEVEEEEEEEKVEEKVEDDEKKSMARPSVVESIGQLQTLHGALSEFLLHYNSLQQTLDSIQSTISTRFKSLDSIQSITATAAAAAKEEEANKKKKDRKREQVEEKPTSSAKNEKEPPSLELKEKKEKESELEIICKTMSAKALRKYVVNNLDEVDRLRREVPEALKRAPNVGRLVLNAIGRFYTQSNNAYRSQSGDSQTVLIRRGCILLLELYLVNFSPTPDTNQSCKEDAAVASNVWRNRIVQEGGIDSAGAVDALGLVLLLASFLIPPEFLPSDLSTLLRLSNLKKKAAVFRRSPILLEKMPDIIRDLIAKGMQVEAVDLICAFELGGKFPLMPLLSSFVRKTFEITEERKGLWSTRSLKEAYEKQLVALKSVVERLEEHNLDASELASLNINQKIAKLEREIPMMVQKLQDKNSKRKLEDVKPFKSPEPQAKRPWSASTAEASHGLIDESGIGLVAGSVHGRAGGWHGNGVAYQTSVGQSLPGMPYLTGGNLTGQPAAAGKSLYHPPALPHGMGGMDSGTNFYQFSDTVLRHEPYYYSKPMASNDMPTAPNAGHYFSNVVPPVPSSGHHFSNAVPAAPNTGHHFGNAMPAAANTGHHLPGNAMPTAANTGHHLPGNAMPTAANTGHHFSNAMPTAPNTGHHLPVEFASAPFGNDGSYNRSH